MSPTTDTKPKSWFNSVRVRIYLSILGAMLPIIIGLGYYIWLQYQDLVDDNLVDAQNVVLSTAEYNQNILHQSVQTLESIAYVPVIRNENWYACSEFLRHISNRVDLYVNMGVIDIYGQLRCSANKYPRSANRDLSNREYFNKALKKIDPIVSECLPPIVGTRPSVVVALRVPSYDGVTAGIAFVVLNLDLLHIENNWSLLQPRGKIWVLDRNGTVLHSVPDEISARGDILQNIDLNISDLQQSQFVDERGRSWFRFIRPVSMGTSTTVFYVLYEVPKSVIYEQANNYLKFGFGFLILLLLLAGSIGWVLVRLAAGKSLEELSKAVIRLGNNDFDTRVAHLLQGSELQEIGHQFDAMAATIKDSAASLRQSEFSYRMLFDSIPNSMLVLSLYSGKIMAANAEASRMYGYSKEEFLQIGLPELRMAILKGGGHDLSKERHVRKDGRSLFVEVRSLSLEFAGESAHVLLVRDVTDREVLSNDLRERERLIENLLDLTVEAICDLDVSGNCIFANKASARLLGYSSPDDLLGKNFHTLAHYKKEDGNALLIDDCVIQNNMKKGLGSHVEGDVFWRRDGTSFSVEYWTYPIWIDGRLDSCLLTFLDISDRVNQQKALTYQAKHDALTGLYNRGEIYRYVSQFIDTQPYRSLIIVLANIDNFKEVNESLSHDVGDLMLQCVSDRLRNELSADAMLSRIGGDEFVFIIKDKTIEYACDYIEELLHIVREPYVLSGLQIRVSMSFGIAHYRAHADSVQDLFRFADIAMRKAKKDSLGIVVYDVSYSAKSHEKLMLRSEILTALEEQQFLLYMQPKIALSNARHEKNKVIGFEALVRWQHPSRGIISPDVFIPIIEVSDLIHDFTARVLDNAVKYCAGLQPEYPGMRVAINVSVKNLLEDGFVDKIAQTLDAYKLNPNLLEIEVTESSLMADPDKVMANLTAINKLGVLISVDDFGTGYSSFAYLNSFPINVLKIDKSFIIGMEEDTNQSVIVKSIIDMAHTLNIAVVAEGIEKQAVIRSLYEMGCDAGQGFYIGKPMNIKDAENWLASYQHDLV